jgi:hypothetical protein
MGVTDVTPQVITGTQLVNTEAINRTKNTQKKLSSFTPAQIKGAMELSSAVEKMMQAAKGV